MVIYIHVYGCKDAVGIACVQRRGKEVTFVRTHIYILNNNTVVGQEIVRGWDA